MELTKDVDTASRVETRSLGAGPQVSRHETEAPNDVDVAIRRAAKELADFDQSFEIKSDSRYLVHNRTPYLIHLAHPDGRFGDLILPPLADRVIKGARIGPFEELLRPHRQRHEVFLRRYVERISLVAKLVWFAWLAVLVPAGIAVYDVLRFGTIVRLDFLIAAVGAAVAITGVLILAAYREVKRKRAAVMEGYEAGDIAYGVGGSYSDGNETARGVRALFTFVSVVMVGAVMPTAAILIATDASDFLIFEGGLRVKAGLESRLVARIIQIIYTCVLSLFPALLFFQFDNLRAGSVRSEWIRALFRMDGRMRTLADVSATYGPSMYQASSNSEDSVRGLGGKNSPIAIATILIALGWTVLVVRTESFDFSGVTTTSQQALVAEEQADIAAEAADSATSASTPEEANAAAAEAQAAATAAEQAQDVASQTAETSTQSEPVETTATTVADPTPVTPTTLALEDAQAAAEAARRAAAQAALSANVNETQIQSTQFFQVLAPNPSAAGMAFLGAYFYGVYLVLRSYFRGDLRAKLYNQITARLVTVVVVAYLINAIMFTNTDQQRLVWALAFLAGVVPTTVLNRVLHSVGRVVENVSGSTFGSDRPLEHIDGIDIFDASRLEAEGVPDVAALATSDLTEVMIHSRIPIGRLVDWADQAAMMIVVGGPGSQLDTRVRALRDLRIRTGTDLLAAVERGKNLDEIAQCLRIPPNAGPIGLWGEHQLRKHGGDGVANLDKAAAALPSSVTDISVDDPAVVIGDIDFDELCNAIRRQPVMSQILQWRSSALEDLDHSWIRLPDLHAEPPVSQAYSGPLPTQARQAISTGS